MKWLQALRPRRQPRAAYPKVGHGSNARDKPAVQSDMRNLRLAYRTLFRTPLVTGVAVLSLALGIGANAAIYSLFHELLLAPLPVPHPEQLVIFGGNTPTPGGHQTTLAGGDSRWVFSYPMFRDLETQSGGGPFTGIAAHQDFTANIAFRRNTVNVSAEYVSGSYF